MMQLINFAILEKKQLPEVAHNPFHATDLFLYLLKISENQRFSMFSGGRKKDRGMKWVKYYEKHKKHKKAKVFRRYRNGTLA